MTLPCPACGDSRQVTVEIKTADGRTVSTHTVDCVDCS